MKSPIKIIGSVAAVLIVVVIAIPFLMDVNAFRPRIEAELSTALGRAVTRRSARTRSFAPNR